jgi:hypothetical protein
MLKIYIDESGSFVSAEEEGSWNITAALVMTSPDERKCKEALRRLKVKCGSEYDAEIKLKHVSEQLYLEFLADLGETGCTLFAVAADAAVQSDEEIKENREGQALKIEENIDKMIHPVGADSVRQLAARVRALSPQLYIQLVCQIELMADVVEKSILYYVQRNPSQLNGFRWRIDEKTGAQSNFEETFRIIVPPLLQTKSVENPHYHVTDFDYSAMSEFVYAEGSAPAYLEEHYDIDTSNTDSLNIGKIVWDDFTFVDSKLEIGVQVVDLLASGLRRVLRGGFSEPDVVSKALGKLMVESVENSFPLKLIRLSGEDSIPDETAVKASEIFKASQKSMFT